MARKSRRKDATSSEAHAGDGVRERITDAFMNLLAEKKFEQIELADIARSAEVSLARLRSEFSSPLAILGAHTKSVDRAVLERIDADLDDESPRERLFDILMSRLEVLEPRKQAVRSLLRSARRNLGLALALNALALGSQQWMLAAAGISAAGPRGILRAQGLALLYASVLRTWVDDDDPGHARTMAALDRALSLGQQCATMLDGVLTIAERFCRSRAPRRRGTDGEQRAART